MTRKEESATEFIRRIEDLHKDKYRGKHIYRGINTLCNDREDGNSSGLYRWAKKNNINFTETFLLHHLEESIVKQSNSKLALSSKKKEEVLTDIQHLGGKTNLIDFSYSIYVALFFACYEANDITDKEDGMLVLFKWQEPIKKIRYDSPLKKYQVVEATTTGNTNDLVVSQRSVFVYPSAGYIDAKDYRMETIPKKLKKGILSILENFHHISISTIYCDVQASIADEENFKNSNVCYSQGHILHKQGMNEEAIKYFDKAIELNPQLDVAFINRGMANVKLGNYSEAIEDYDKAIELDPDYAGAYNNRGNVWLRLKNYKNASSDYDKAIAISPDYAKAYDNRGYAWSEQGEYEKAIEDFNAAIKINPQFSLAYFNKGNASLQLKQYDDAINNYDKAIAINPNDSKAYNNRGIAKANLNKFEDAIDDYNKAIAINPNHSEAYDNRGYAWSKLGEYEKAIEDFNAVIKINPQFSQAYFNIGNASVQLNQCDDAIKGYSKAIELSPDYVEAYYNRGVAKYELKKYNEAIKDFDEAIKIDPKFALAYYFRGKYKARSDDKEGAKADFKIAKDFGCKLPIPPKFSD